MFKFNEVKITGLKASWIPANKNHDGYMAPVLQLFNTLTLYLLQNILQDEWKYLSSQLHPILYPIRYPYYALNNSLIGLILKQCKVIVFFLLRGPEIFKTGFRDNG